MAHNLSILQWNICSYKSKNFFLQSVVRARCIDVVMLQETLTMGSRGVLSPALFNTLMSNILDIHPPEGCRIISYADDLAVIASGNHCLTRAEQKAVCLICQEAVAVFKEYNLRRHYESRHKDKYDSLQGQMRADKLSKLKSGLLAQQNTFVCQSQLKQSSVRASFRVAQLIASSGKLFTDGEFVKKCMNAVAEVCPEKKDVFNAVSLSASTITRRIEEIGALDESTDVQDSAQLLIFIRGVSANFEMCEELAALQSLKGTTTGEDIFGKVYQTMEELDLDWSKLASITTDGAPRMVGMSRGLIGRMNREMEERGLTAPLQVHCLIHQQALCCKVLTWDSVMKVVVSCINSIRAKGLKHRQFQEFLSELESTQRSDG
ncbi:general transcription factor II-I repeat domain-containing protein 2-like [Penaeus vannamei]|uniref:general transcription factor II-I repeat domain-containing protein 2-like n=1 Tax=Penaeus vannamei TaxID=6689 RepID=UPI00387FAB65